MDSDPELEAIRARLRQEIAQAATAQPAPASQPQGALDRPVDVDDASLPAFVQEHAFAVIDVWAPWCGPCRIVGPIVDDLAREMRGRVAFGKLNADENPRTMGTFGIQGIPTLLMFKDGRFVDRVVGAAPKPQLAAMIERARTGATRTGAVGPRR